MLSMTVGLGYSGPLRANLKNIVRYFNSVTANSNKSSYQEYVLHQSCKKSNTS